jgi:hypothetical protein
MSNLGRCKMNPNEENGWKIIGNHSLKEFPDGGWILMKNDVMVNVRVTKSLSETNEHTSPVLVDALDSQKKVP